MQKEIDIKSLCYHGNKDFGPLYDERKSSIFGAIISILIVPIFICRLCLFLLRIQPLPQLIKVDADIDDNFPTVNSDSVSQTDLIKIKPCAKVLIADFLNIKLGRIGIDENTDKRTFKIDPNSNRNLCVWLSSDGTTFDKIDTAKEFSLGNNAALFFIYPQIPFQHTIEINLVFKIQILYESTYVIELSNKLSKQIVLRDDVDKDVLVNEIITERIKELEQCIISSFDEKLHEYLGISKDQNFAKFSNEFDDQRLEDIANRSIISSQQILANYKKNLSDCDDLKKKLQETMADLKSNNVQNGILKLFYGDLINKGININNLTILNPSNISFQDEFNEFKEHYEDAINNMKEIQRDNRQLIDKIAINNLEFQDAAVNQILNYEHDKQLALDINNNHINSPETVKIGQADPE
jgi:hypothetical protein